MLFSSFILYNINTNNNKSDQINESKFILFPKNYDEFIILCKKCIGDSTAMLFGFSAMQMVPLSVYAILMNLKAMLVIIIAHFYLNDKITFFRLFLVTISFIGALFVVYPSILQDLVGMFNQKVPAKDNSSSEESKFSESISPSIISN